MNLNEYLTDNNFEKRDLTILYSVGCVLNTENGDTFPMMNDNSFDFDDPCNVLDMNEDRFSSEEWFETLAFWDEVMVDDTINRLSKTDIPGFEGTMEALNGI